MSKATAIDTSKNAPKPDQENKKNDDGLEITRANSVFALGFPTGTTEEQVTKFFQDKAGNCVKAMVRTGKPPATEGEEATNDNAEKEIKTFAFVFFSTPESTEAASALNDTEFAPGAKLTIEGRRNARGRGRGRGGRGRGRGRGRAAAAGAAEGAADNNKSGGRGGRGRRGRGGRGGEATKKE